MLSFSGIAKMLSRNNAVSVFQILMDRSCLVGISVNLWSVVWYCIVVLYCIVLCVVAHCLTYQKRNIMYCHINREELYHVQHRCPFFMDGHHFYAFPIKVSLFPLSGKGVKPKCPFLALWREEDDKRAAGRDGGENERKKESV